MGTLRAVGHRVCRGAAWVVLRPVFGDVAIVDYPNQSRWFGVWRSDTTTRSIFVRIGRTEIVLETRRGLRRLRQQREVLTAV